MANPKITTALVAGFLLLSACAPRVYELVPEEVTTRNMAPPGAPPGTCWGRDATPAVIETVTKQVILEEAETPVYQTETSQQIITPREDTWFETPCDDVMTPDFTATVQRALQARGHYRGPITGRMDGRTRAAIRAYQKPQGLDSGMLSLAAARQMGLMQVDLEDAGLADPPAVAVAALDADTPVAVSQAPVAESAAAEAARLADEQTAARLAAIERAEAQQAENARAMEAAKLAEAQAAEEKRRVEAAAAAERAARDKNRRAKELAQALEEERQRTGGTVFDPLPISTESY